MQSIACSAITAEHAAGLAKLNIFLRDATGIAFMWLDPDTSETRKEIGRVTVHIATGLIEIFPNLGATEPEIDILRGVAFESTWQPPAVESDWSLVTSKTRGQYWECAANVLLGDHDPLMHAYRTALTARKQQNKAFDLAYSSAA